MYHVYNVPLAWQNVETWESLYNTRIVTYYVGHSSRGLWGLVWSDLINLNYVVCIGSQRYHFLWLYNKIGWKKHKKQVWFASLVWYDRVSSVETSLFRPSIYLVWVLGALEALQCIICHYLRTDGITDGRNYGITDEQIRPSIIID